MYYLVAFALVIGVLVTFHEAGHFIAARSCGVKVLRFSIGFGPVLWSRRIGVDRTEWALSLIPLGGYVKMLDEREGDVAASELSRAFNRQSVGKRSLIVAAGPFANFFLAILLYWGIFIHGSDELLPLLGTPPDGTPAATLAIHNGAQVRSVDGKAVATWNEFRWLLLEKAAGQDSVELELQEGDHLEFLRLPVTAAAERGWEGDVLEHLGIRFYRPHIPAVIGTVQANSPAVAAGIVSGDRMLAVNGQVLATWQDFVERVRRSPGQRLQLEVERGGDVFTVDVLPEAFSDRGKLIGRIGVAVAETPELQRPVRVFVRHDVAEALQLAIAETWDKSIFSLVMMGKMLTGEVSWKNLSGPVTIADYAGQSARLGLDYYLKFMALVSISLGVLNLLPVPVLDGGHLLYHMMEVVRRRPLSERAMEAGQRVGMALLFALMAFAFFNDLSRLFNG